MKTQSHELFQSHFGSIKTVDRDLEPERGRSFNPTLVRLKRGDWNVRVVRAEGFQSHFGSIKTRERMKQLDVKIEFQSHFGSIKTVPGAMRTSPRESFNPTLVRLKLLVLCVDFVQPVSFQSHFGSIKTVFKDFRHSNGRDVSIPLWFD